MKARLPIRVLRYAALLAFSVFIIAPALWLFSTAFKAPAEILLGQPSFIPAEPTLENFFTVFDEQPILRSAVNSLVVAGASALLTVLMALPAAYWLARTSGPGTRWFVAWVIVSQMLPYILIAVPLFIILIRFGLYNNLAGLILVYSVWSLPFAIWILRNFVTTIPRELEEASAVDGASRTQTLRLIVAPLLVPGLVVTAMFTFVNAWNEFFFALVLISDQSLAPLSLLLVKFIGIDGALRTGPLAAAALISAIPSVIVFALLQGRITGGLLGGAVKG